MRVELRRNNAGERPGFLFNSEYIPFENTQSVAVAVGNCHALGEIRGTLRTKSPLQRIKPELEIAHQLFDDPASDAVVLRKSITLCNRQSTIFDSHHVLAGGHKVLEIAITGLPDGGSSQSDESIALVAGVTLEVSP